MLFSVQLIKQYLHILNSGGTLIFVLQYVDYLVLHCWL